MFQIKHSFYLKKILLLFINFLIFLLLVFVLFSVIKKANLISGKNPISFKIIVSDILFGIFIYLKTSLDFVIYAGSFIKVNKKIKNLGAFITGTSIGNSAGVFLIIFIWAIVRNFKWFLFFAILVSSVTLFFLGSKNINEFWENYKKEAKPGKANEEEKLGNKSFKQVFISSLKLPFILGIDDFAGYIPLFNILNITSFSIGVLLGHFFLTSFILINEKPMRKVVSFKFFDLFGGLIFIAIATWGIVEAFSLF